MLEEVIKSRRSISKFKSDVIDNEVLDEIISLSVYAPSSCNTQPWHFLIFSSDESKEKLNKHIALGYERIKVDLNEKKIFGKVYESLLAFFAQYGKFDDAPVYVLVFAKKYDAPIFSQAIQFSKNVKIEKIAQESVQTSVAMAMQNFLLIAHEKGLGARVKDGIKFLLEFEDLKKAFYADFGISQDWKLISGIQIGYPLDSEKKQKPKTRRPLNEIRKII